MDHSTTGIFLTDDLNQYQSADRKNKILFYGSQVKQSTFLTDEEIISMNFNLSGAEIEAGEQSVEHINRLVAGAADTSQAELYSFLFGPLTKYGMARFQLELLLQEIERQTEISQMEFNLGAEYAWFKNTHPEKEIVVRSERKKTSFVRNLAALVGTKTPKSNSGKTENLLILSYNIGHHLEIFRPFIQYTLAHSTTICFDIVILDFFENENFKPENHVGKINGRVRFHRFKDFRTTVRSGDQKLVDSLIEKHPELKFLHTDQLIEARNLQKAWMQKCFRVLRPSAAFICNIHEIGRIMSDVGKQTGIPSIQVDYGLFADHHIMNSAMHFSLRACLGDSTKDVWEKRGDKSDRIVPIGFLKLDETNIERAEITHKTPLWKKFGLDPLRPTVFFASTWAGSGEIYDLEKKHLCSYLSDFCRENNYNFLIKLHPLEAPDDLKELIRPEAGQHVCMHAELDLNDALAFSDVVITQGSSIVVESLFWGKWPVFMGIKDTKKLILAGMTNEDDIHYFTPGPNFEDFVHQSLHSETFKNSLIQKTQQFKQRILFSTDQQASKRLFEETLKLLRHDLAG